MTSNRPQSTGRPVIRVPSTASALGTGSPLQHPTGLLQSPLVSDHSRLLRFETKYVYSFSQACAEGDASMRSLLGGKGANLHEMCRTGLRVPPGFTITTAACTAFMHTGQRPPDLDVQVTAAMDVLEGAIGRKFGRGSGPGLDQLQATKSTGGQTVTPPLFVSVRSGAAVSMPGMMDTVLNLGINDESLEHLTLASGSRRFALDCYRRFIGMFADVVKGVSRKPFEAALTAARGRAGVKTDAELSEEALEQVVAEYKVLYQKVTGEPLPTDPRAQLDAAIDAVLKSWETERARAYRRLHKIADDLGTAVNVQAMVYGNYNQNSATGVAFSRDPSSGNPQMFGEFLRNAQGEDVVAGIRTPESIGQMAIEFPDAYAELMEARETLEAGFRDMQDMEFTVEDGVLYMLQTRSGKRTGRAAVRIAVDLVQEQILTRAEALLRIDPSALEQYMRPIFVEKALESARCIGTGLPAGPGAGVGRLVMTSAEAEAMSTDQGGKEGKRKPGEQVAGKPAGVVLIRNDTSPDDIKGMAVANAIVTVHGGMTSHAAVVARQLGLVAVVGVGNLRVDEEAGVVMRAADGEVLARRGDLVSVDGSTGRVFFGPVDLAPSQVLQVMKNELAQDQAPEFQLFATVLYWSDQERRLGVRANADQADQAEAAMFFGAEGIGLCRTEHMFFKEGRIDAVRRMILARSDTEREGALHELEVLQRSDFEALFRTMAGRPVTVRMLDPPLHEFLPHTPDEQRRLAAKVGLSFEEVVTRTEALMEKGPMMGWRGCRLGVTFPGLTQMQARALFAAAQAVKAGGQETPILELMIPLVTVPAELAQQKAEIALAAKALNYTDKYLVGTMIETPRACLVAAALAEDAEFFSFGTNDLTQGTYLLSRDDAGRFLPEYVERRLMRTDPFQTLDITGVGELITMGVKRGRSTRPDIKTGICGEHGGDPDSVAFCHRTDLDYVSCSPYRIPIARLAAAQAAIRERQARGGQTRP
eukprot:TRINITY_DN67545_c0_g1_i1.p1 TRINITY_DN67545_c0_g1~~TRINITY_DN67545_c0_g1_i1.p1  ORF type:complete len:986 (-),score=283.43 TRINITY_DN67545_c0_g1_i1:259-3216(-)